LQRQQLQRWAPCHTSQTSCTLTASRYSPLGTGRVCPWDHDHPTHFTCACCGMLALCFQLLLLLSPPNCLTKTSCCACRLLLFATLATRGTTSGVSRDTRSCGIHQGCHKGARELPTAAHISAAQPAYFGSDLTI
jgi:hypothetical protein